jgi:prepilin-type N-terminal cleavage/methylation domain-containing protein/prepilin-type processing-associated H-X9-DG protein
MADWEGHMRRRSGFTLVELLIVIGVIVVLIVILLPALAKARVASNRVACRAQLGDIGRFFQMYLNDSKGKLPCVQTMPSVQPPEPPVLGKPLTQILEPYVKDSKKVFRCPADQIRIQTPGAPDGYVTWFEREGLSYLYNPSLSILYAGQRLNETRLYRDGKQNQLRILNDFEPFHGRANTNGSCNYLFADTHVGDLANE